MTHVNVRRILPQHDYVLIQRQDETVTEGGILLPQQRNELAQVGRALRVGPGLWDAMGQKFAPCHTEPGTVVFFSEGPDSIRITDTWLLVRDYCCAGRLVDHDLGGGDEAGLEDLENLHDEEGIRQTQRSPFAGERHEEGPQWP